MLKIAFTVHSQMANLAGPALIPVTKLKRSNGSPHSWGLHIDPPPNCHNSCNSYYLHYRKVPVMWEKPLTSAEVILSGDLLGMPVAVKLPLANASLSLPDLANELRSRSGNLKAERPLNK